MARIVRSLTLEANAHPMKAITAATIYAVIDHWSRNARIVDTRLPLEVGTTVVLRLCCKEPARSVSLYRSLSLLLCCLPLSIVLLAVSPRKVLLVTPLNRASSTTVDSFSLRREPSMASNLLVMSVAIAFANRRVRAAIHYAHRRIPMVFPLWGQTSVCADLLVMPGAVPPCPCWAVTVGCLADRMLSVHVWSFFCRRLFMTPPSLLCRYSELTPTSQAARWAILEAVSGERESRKRSATARMS